jgi:hypothetical protein
MRLARTERHPEREGLLHIFECTGCKLPAVIFSPPHSFHLGHRGYDLYAVQDGGGWSVYVYPMDRGLPDFTAEHQLIEHPEKEDAIVIARNRIDSLLASQSRPQYEGPAEPEPLSHGRRFPETSTEEQL